MVKSGGDPWMRMGIVICIYGVYGPNSYSICEYPRTRIMAVSWRLPLPFTKSILPAFVSGIGLGICRKSIRSSAALRPCLLQLEVTGLLVKPLNTQGMISVSLISIAILSLAFRAKLGLYRWARRSHCVVYRDFDCGLYRLLTVMA